MDACALNSSFSKCLIRNSNLEIIELHRSHPLLYIQSRNPRIRCCSMESDGGDRKRKWHCLLQPSTTLTVVSFPLVEGDTLAKVSEKKQAKRSKLLSISPDEVKSWSRDLLAFRNRIPYTKILDLKSQGKLKHVVKLPNFSPQCRPEAVLVVLDDSRVLRAVLPAEERDLRFWESWDHMGIGSLYVNVYTLPVQIPDPPKLFFGFLQDILAFLISLFPLKPQSKQAIELQMARKALRVRKREEIAKLREMMVVGGE